MGNIMDLNPKSFEDLYSVTARIGGRKDSPVIRFTSYVIGRQCGPDKDYTGRTWYAGSDANILTLVAQNWDSRRAGYRDGVCLVPVPVADWFCPYVQLKAGDEVRGEFQRRRDDEDPRLSLWSADPNPDAMPAASVEIVCYTSAVLAEGKDNAGDATNPDSWEVVSLNSSFRKGPIPIHPRVLMYNHFAFSGGTDTNMTASEFVQTLGESFVYWHDIVPTRPEV
jgi:hypothetical protein